MSEAYAHLILAYWASPGSSDDAIDLTEIVYQGFAQGLFAMALSEFRAMLAQVHERHVINLFRVGLQRYFTNDCAPTFDAVMARVRWFESATAIDFRATQFPSLMQDVVVSANTVKLAVMIVDCFLSHEEMLPDFVLHILAPAVYELHDVAAQRLCAQRLDRAAQARLILQSLSSADVRAHVLEEVVHALNADPALMDELVGFSSRLEELCSLDALATSPALAVLLISSWKQSGVPPEPR